MKIDHIAMWADDIEVIKDFYVKYFNAAAGEIYHNQAKCFTSYFLTFPGNDARLEIMNVPEIATCAVPKKLKGYCHIALSVGSRDMVDEMTERLRSDGLAILGNPRTTGDGCYESVIADLEGNIVEICE